MTLPSSCVRVDRDAGRIGPMVGAATYAPSE